MRLDVNKPLGPATLRCPLYQKIKLYLGWFARRQLPTRLQPSQLRRVRQCTWNATWNAGNVADQHYPAHIALTVGCTKDVVQVDVGCFQVSTFRKIGEVSFTLKCVLDYQTAHQKRHHI